VFYFIRQWGQKSNQRRSTFVTTREEYIEHMTDRCKKVVDFHMIGESAILLEWEYEDEATPIQSKLNPYIAVFTTSHARLRLYEALELLQDRVLYTDTDSVVFKVKQGQVMPELGPYLGEFTNELPEGTHITEFGSGGPKNYAYRVSNGDEVVKVRGFTLNSRNRKVINADSVLDLIQRKDFTTTLHTHDPMKITRNKRTFEISNRQETKKYKLCFSKRQLQAGSYVTQAFGFRG
jgi:hypothetical protein